MILPFPRAIHELTLSHYSYIKSAKQFPIYNSIYTFTLSVPDSAMEAFGVLKFWWNAATGADVESGGGDLRADDYEEADNENSFIDLVLKSPDSVAVKRGDVTAKNNFHFVKSPRDVCASKNNFSNSNRLYPVALLRSTPKFKVLMFGFRKSSKCEKTESDGEFKSSPVNQLWKSPKIEESNHFSVTCREEKLAGACSLSRDNSLRSQLLKETSDYEISLEKSSRNSVPKYLKLIKPLFLMVWKRQNEKTKFTDSLTPSASPVTAPANLSPRKFSETSRIGSFKIVAKRLGKSRSASAVVGVAPLAVSRRDDSLLERHNGIQSAVLYCKKSYNSSSKEFSQSSHSSSDPSHRRRNSCEEPKRCSI